MCNKTVKRGRAVLGTLMGVAWLWLLGAGPAHAVLFQTGDLFASTGSGQVQHYDASGTLLETLDTTRGGFTTGSAFDSAGNLYVTNFSDNTVSRFNNGGTLTEAVFIDTGTLGGGAPESIVFDMAGNFYVGHADGNRDIMKFDAAGNYLQSFDVGTTDRGSDWIDLAADQQTIYYTSEGDEILRYDAATDTQLSNFADFGQRPTFALRLLDDGGILAASSATILRFDAAGTVIQSYDSGANNNWFALNLDPDGDTFWSGDFGTGQIAQFDIDSGALLQTISTGSSQLYGVSLYGEITQGGGGGGEVPVPLPASLVLFAVGMLAMAAGGWRRRVTA